MISVLGIGGAGGNIADEAYKMGYLTGAINFSQKDLDSINVNFKMRLPASEGVGRNRDLAIKLMQDHWKIAVDFIKQNFAYSDVIIVTFSTSGGTGSGISPMLLELLTNLMPAVTFIALPIIPDYTEVTVNQLNVLNTFNELSNLDIAVFPIDNQQIKDNYFPISKSLLYKKVNESTIYLLDRLIKYTEENYSKNGNFDKKDLMAVLNTKGIGIISEVDISTYQNNLISTGIITEAIQKSWYKSPFIPIEYQKVVRAGIIVDANDKYMEFINHQSIFNKFNSGMPIDLFEGYCDTGDNKIITILTGLPWCNNRLQKIDQIIQKDKNKIENILMSNNEQFETKSINLMDSVRQERSQETTSVNQIINKYRNKETIANDKINAIELISKYRR